jgi:hypothetical protein
MELLISRLLISVVIILFAFFTLRATWTKNINPMIWIKKSAESIVPENKRPVQSTPVVARGVGVYAHWTVVLMVIPLLSGLVLRLLRVPNVIFIIGAGSVVTAGILLYLYNRYLFAQPLNPLGGVFYAFVLACLSYIPNIRLRSRGDVASEPVAPTKGNSPDAFDFFGGIKYGGAIATLQLLVSILALVFSIVGIFIGSSVRG